MAAKVLDIRTPAEVAEGTCFIERENAMVQGTKELGFVQEYEEQEELIALVAQVHTKKSSDDSVTWLRVCARTKR
jgi:hypothetical protein